MKRQIIAAFDKEGIMVYQAFRRSIVDAALARGTFAKGFNVNRMTWIKPSFGWMLYRSDYATKHRQDAIVQVKLTHKGFRAILLQSVPTSFDPEFYHSEHSWRNALAKSEVRHQWDPDRDLLGRPIERRAIQIGISGSTVCRYVDEWIIDLRDMTQLARSVHRAILASTDIPPVPPERPYAIDDEIASRLGIGLPT
jgi:hypothetical protein